MTKNQQSAIGAIFLCFGLVANAETKSNEQWVEYFLDQISGIRVEISRLETDGVVEELRRDQALEESSDYVAFQNTTNDVGVQALGLGSVTDYQYTFFRCLLNRSPL